MKLEREPIKKNKVRRDNLKRGDCFIDKNALLLILDVKQTFIHKHTYYEAIQIIFEWEPKKIKLLPEHISNEYVDVYHSEVKWK